jgi:hypothetical protein
VAGLLQHGVVDVGVQRSECIAKKTPRNMALRM